MSITAPLLDREEFIPPRDLPGVAPRSYEAHFVWGFWEILFVLALAWVYQYGSRIPLLENWLCIDFLTVLSDERSVISGPKASSTIDRRCRGS